MNIALVGGGKRCLRFMDLIDSYTFEEVLPRIVAVADVRPDAPGFVRAKAKGIFVTHDYNDFFKIPDIQLIIELTGSMDIYNDILAKKSRDVRAVASATAHFFWELARVNALQRHTARQLEKTEAMCHLVFNELIHDDMLVIAADYRIVDANDSLLRRIGMERNEVIGRFCHEITHHQSLPCTGEEHPCPLVNTLKSRKSTQTTHVHLDRLGRKIYYSIICYPLIQNDVAVGAVEISRDITRDIQFQKTMMLQEKMASIGRLSAGVAHEINNPLTTILTTAMLLQEDLPPSDPLYKELETITSESLRCRRIVTSLLDFSRQSAPEKKPWHINDVVSESVLLTQKQAKFKDIHLSQHLAETNPILVLDKGQIQQAVINLVINAIEATDPGGTVSVATKLDLDAKKVDITVQDSGCGMSEEVIGRIFDPFFTAKENGTGLGLAITHGIVEQHEGKIDVESFPGKGSTFTIRLPLRHGKP